MTSITEIAENFFVACDTGKDWDGCRTYCTPNATFSAQAEPLLDVRTLQQYCDWMKGFPGVRGLQHARQHKSSLDEKSGSRKEHHTSEGLRLRAVLSLL